MKKKSIIELTRCDVEGYRELEKLPVKVMCDNVRSMHNIGAIFRTSDAFLIDEVILTGISGRPPHPEIAKTALGAENSVKWSYAEDSLSEALRLQAAGWRIAVLEQAHGSLPLQEFHRVPGERIVLVVGNEVEGVDQRIVDMADICLEIPQHGTKHSLNVSCSAAIALWQIVSS
ncbi:MAG: TrmH family RNA methyltransferase [Muribaculaceae bacterium]|nr:TrmH family RNA methyltransferase [Muribaculaceae bacterium]